jgi:uncharacterized short protein YbdD (DUF466 family)
VDPGGVPEESGRHPGNPVCGDDHHGIATIADGNGRLLVDERKRMAHLMALIRRIAGMPDYQAYLVHQRAKHPGDPPLTEREFYDRYLESRYGGAGSRCC